METIKDAYEEIKRSSPLDHKVLKIYSPPHNANISSVTRGSYKFSLMLANSQKRKSLRVKSGVNLLYLKINKFCNDYVVLTEHIISRWCIWTKITAERVILTEFLQL